MASSVPMVSGLEAGLAPGREPKMTSRRRLAAAARLLAALGLGLWIAVTADIPDWRWAGPALGAAAFLAMAYGARFPVVSLVVAFGELVIHGQFGGSSGDNAFVVMLAWASFGVGRHAAIARQPWAAAGALLLVSLNLTDSGAQLPEQVVFPTLFTAAPWILGLLVQLSSARATRAESEAREIREARDEEMRAAAEAERLRIARDLHDVAAHSLSVVSLTAQLARRQSEAGIPPEGDTLREIERSAKEAMSALRGVVGALRPPDGSADLVPTPSISRLEALLREAESAGQRVTFEQSGRERILPPGADLAAYRVVQESLTNARRHGAGAGASVSLGWEPDHLEIVVLNDTAPGPRTATAGGLGLVGMRERVELVGGTVSAGPDVADRWRVRALIPAEPLGAP